MNRKLLTIACLIMGLIMFCNLSVLMQNGQNYQASTICRDISEGTPYRYANERSGVAALSDYCVKGNRVFLLFEEVGILKIYDLSGNYLHSYAFHIQPNGMSTLHVDEQYVYLQDQSHNIYAFLNGEFKAFFGYEDSARLKNYLDSQKRLAFDGFQYKKYMKKWASIVALAEDGTEKTVIARPFYLVLFEPIATYLIQFLCMAFFAVLYFRTRRK